MPRGLGRERKRKQTSNDDHTPTPDSNSVFVPVTEMHPRRARKATSHLRIPALRVAIATPNNVYLTQIQPSDVRRWHVPRPSAATSHSAAAAHHLPPTAPAAQPVPHPIRSNTPGLDAPSTLLEDPVNSPDTVQPLQAITATTKLRRTHDHLKNQAKRWHNIVLPSLRRPFFKYLQRFGLPEKTTQVDSDRCTCKKQQRVLCILALYFNSAFIRSVACSVLTLGV